MHVDTRYVGGGYRMSGVDGVIGVGAVDKPGPPQADNDGCGDHCDPMKSFHGTPRVLWVLGKPKSENGFPKH